MRLTDLRRKKVRSLDGKAFGRVHEVHADKGRVIALMCGAASLIERLTARNAGRRIPWELVKRIDADFIIIADPSEVRPRASRSRRDTRRPSARRSKR